MGCKVYDPATGKDRVNLGALSNGDYVLQVTDVDGTTSEMLPIYTVFNGPSVSTSSTSYVPIGNAITVPFGASGTASVTASSNIQNTTSNQTGYANTFVDGSDVGLCYMFVSNPGTDIAASASITQEITGLSTGNHKFQMYGRSSLSGSDVNYSNMGVEIRPM